MSDMEEKEFTYRALELVQQAVKLAEEQRNAEVEPIHMLGAFVEPAEDGSTGYLQKLIEKTGSGDFSHFEESVRSALRERPSANGAAQLSLHRNTAKVLSKAHEVRKKQGDSFTSQEHILLALLDDITTQMLLKRWNIDPNALKEQVKKAKGKTKIDSKNADPNFSLENLDKYAIDMTQLARTGELDPVIGRDEEIRSTIRVLARRIKSNPCLIGEPGTGKTAIIEGVAQRIINGDVPAILNGCKLYSLDHAALAASCKYRGDFEERLKGVINEIENSPVLIILFVDEIHMLMKSDYDAANILKPALSRGRLKVIGATTYNEYRSIVQKDGAFERRFQTINVNEPSVREAIAILRGLQGKYEIHHGVRILDSALVTAAQLAKRYFSSRRLPDSAIDLMDIACATVAVARDSKPEELDRKERELQLLQVELNALERDKDADAVTEERLQAVRQKEASLLEELKPLRQRYEDEHKHYSELTEAKAKLEELENKAADSERNRDYQRAADLRYFAIPEVKKHIMEMEAQIAEEEESANVGDRMIQNVVGSETIAETAARLTGIPVTKLTESENSKLIHMERCLAEQVVGQMEAIKAVSKAVRLSRSGLANPKQPSSFLFLGLSGSGKTELAKKLAAFLFNDDAAMIRVDCSELSEKHSVSKLLGTTAGYIGFDEGGLLTNQLQRKPYSVILFDEVEKAHPDVLTILLQILDDGRITSGQGTTVNCSNCIVIMTSNLGASYIAAQPSAKITDATKELVMQDVRAHFRPEFLNRISSIVVFNRLSRKAIHKIVDIRLAELEARFDANNKHYKLQVSPEARDFLATNGYSDSMGARPLNRLIERELLDKLALRVLRDEIKDKETVIVEYLPDKKCLTVLANHPASNPAVADDMDIDDWDADLDAELLVSGDSLPLD